MRLFQDRMDSPVGTLTLVTSDDGLRAVLWEDDDPFRVPLERATCDSAHRVIVITRRQLAEYFGGGRRSFDMPIDPVGTTFQQDVWRALAQIPFGQTLSYGALAHKLGRPAAARAVGAANGRNPLSIVLPCHRVVGASGSLTGFAGGLPVKRWLLDHERRLTAVETTLL